MRRVSDAREERAGGHRHAADRRADRDDRDAYDRSQFEHHEPGRHRHRHRRHGGCGHRHDRERAQASGAGAAGRAASADHHRCLPRSRAGAVFQPADHHRLIPAGVHTRSPGRPDVCAARLHQDVCHGGGGVAFDHAGARADAAVHSRQDHAGEEKPGESSPHLDLPPGHRLGDALEKTHHLRRAGRAGCIRLSRNALGQRIHAGAE